MKHFLLLSLIAVGLLQAKAQDTFNISGNDWLFFYAKDKATADSLSATGFGQRDYETIGFRPTSVPSNWAVLGYEEPVYRGFPNDEASEGFYMKKFKTPKSFRGKRILLHFGGVWNSAEVWVNGHWVGRHDSGYTSFSYNVSDWVKGDTLNTIAVRVRQVYPGYKTDTYDDWTLGGIYRDVTLEAMPRKQWIDNVRVFTSFNKDYSEADVTVRTIVVNTTKNTLPGNYQSPGRDYVLRITLTDPQGKVAAAQDVTVKGHVSTSRDTKTVLHLKNPQKWTAETPSLYKLSVALLGNDGKPTQIHTEKIGVREISTADGVFRINGQAVKLRGVNRHDEHPGVGRAVGPKHWLEDLQLMKKANINYVRACHYQHAKGFIEMCDSIGMYVGAEVSLGGASQMMFDPSFIGHVMLRTQETVERDLNNPSIIYWSVGNEDPFTYMHLRAIRTIKGLDPTRPVLMPWNASELLPDEIDILAPHYWTSHEYDSIAAQSKRPIITTEYVHAYGEQRMGGLEDCWKALTKHPAGAGGAVWMWADQGLRTPVKKDLKKYGSIVKEDPYLRVSAAGWDGITDSYRRPTRDLEEVKAVYCPIEAELKDGKIFIHNNYDFLNLNTVTIHWQVFADYKEASKGQTVLNAEPHQTAVLNINTKKSDYVWLTFTDATGHEIGRRWVEMEEGKRMMDDGRWKSKGKKNLPAIDAATGLPQGFRPTVWHKLNDGDQIIKNRNFAQNPEKFRTKVISLETSGNVTHSVVHYTINDSNSIDASYIITTEEGGGMTISYEITPHLQSNFVPIVGLVYQIKQPNTLKHWFGLGPDEAYPNKQAAGMLGLWSAKGISGTRRMRWVEVDDMRIYCDGYLDRDSADSQEIRLLSHVLGRSEKGRLNYPELQLPQGKTYKGSIILK